MFARRLALFLSSSVLLSPAIHAGPLQLTFESNCACTLFIDGKRVGDVPDRADPRASQHPTLKFTLDSGEHKFVCRVEAAIIVVAVAGTFRFTKNGQSFVFGLPLSHTPNKTFPQIPLGDFKILSSAIPLGRAPTADLARTLRSDDLAARKAAAVALGDMGPLAKDATHDLLWALNEGYPGHRLTDDTAVNAAADAAADALQRIGPVTVAALTSFIALPSWVTNEHAVVKAMETLGEFGPAARDAVPVLAKMLELDTGYTLESTELSITEALAKIGTDTNGVPALMQALKQVVNRSRSARLSAGSLVDIIAKGGNEAVPFLEKELAAMNHGDGAADATNIAYELALFSIVEKLGPTAHEVVTVIQKSLETKQTCAYAAQAIVAVAYQKEDIGALVDALKCEEILFLGPLLDKISVLEPVPNDVVPILVPILVRVLINYRKAYPENRSNDVVAVAARLLGHLGSAAQEALPALRNTAQVGRYSEKRAAEDAIAMIEVGLKHRQ